MQSKRQSRIEAAIQQLIGFGVALISQLIIFPIFDIHINMTDNLLIGIYFAIVSYIRSYAVRRWFNRRHYGIRDVKQKNETTNHP